MPSLAGQIGLGDPDALGRHVVVRRGLGIGHQRGINARQQQAGVRLALHQLAGIARASHEKHHA